MVSEPSFVRDRRNKMVICVQVSHSSRLIEGFGTRKTTGVDKGRGMGLLSMVYDSVPVPGRQTGTASSS